MDPNKETTRGSIMPNLTFFPSQRGHSCTTPSSYNWFCCFLLFYPNTCFLL